MRRDSINHVLVKERFLAIAAKIVYSKKYRVDIGEHVFHTIKYDLIYDRLIKDGLLSKDDFILPKPARWDDILLVHTEDYVQRLRNGTLSPLEILRLELPYSKDLVDSSLLCAGGTILTLRIALKEGMGLHLGGGFHHAFPDHGEGFCVLNDVAIGIKRVQTDRQVQRTLVIDCDLHHGNGTAQIFKGDENVFTFSIHQENNYPFFKPPSNLDIDLPDGVGDDEYLSNLADNIPKIIEEFKPDLILYLAGADPYEDDQLGGLRLTMEGLRKRDEFVFGQASTHRIPVAVVLAGGYAHRLEDTVNIHCNTVKVFSEL